MKTSLKLSDIQYSLPESQIALHPSSERGKSKLLWVDPISNRLQDFIFDQIVDLLPENAFLIANASRVIPARLPARKVTGGSAEVFLLQSIDHPDPLLALQIRGKARWKVMMGGKNIQPDAQLLLPLEANARVLEKSGKEAVIEISIPEAFSSLADYLSQSGKIPLPPYIPRDTTPEDETRYQTIYAQNPGSVAAPTAGLHWTPELWKKLEKSGRKSISIHLHVGAGTFQPIEVEDARQHRMHTERVEWSLEALEELTLALETHRPIIPVGTTSLRSLESLLLLQPGQNQVSQWAGWESLQQASPVERIQLHCQELKKRNLKQLVFETSLMIAPGFPKLHADALITNFHQPGSTLLFLVSAFSDSNWKFAYEYALNHDYQFLSFGDSSFWIHPHSKAYFPKR